MALRTCLLDVRLKYYLKFQIEFLSLEVIADLFDHILPRWDAVYITPCLSKSS